MADPETVRVVVVLVRGLALMEDEDTLLGGALPARTVDLDKVEDGGARGTVSFTFVAVLDGWSGLAAPNAGNFRGLSVASISSVVGWVFRFKFEEEAIVGGIGTGEE